ncbi:hypothetical protein SN811_16180 [Ligilactobacillus agilis]|uniref:Uncharacterized protein n=2 Tax=Ligilactobacillus agilis TaxID=1601 RepID=A0A6F9Y6R9_9LACO|nr:hypothetical protein SN811_16180 [Ligilactobacillus agilis]
MHYLKLILIERRFHPPMLLLIFYFLSILGAVLVLLTSVVKALNSFLASITVTLTELVNVQQAFTRYKNEQRKRKNLKKKNRR